MENANNLFHILDISRREDPHDRILAWLVDPNASHGITNFAANLVEALWGRRCDEPVHRVTRQYKLAADSWPDVVVEFEESLLVVENKVNASAFREGQLERQHELGLEQQGESPLFHVLLCPDRLSTGNYSEMSDSFRVLPYSKLADLVRAVVENITEEHARSNMAQYAEYVHDGLGKPAPSGVRLVSARTISRRNASRKVSEDVFMKEAEQYGDEIRSAQTELLDVLNAMESVEARFDSKGSSNATYKVYIDNTDLHVLWVYSDGRLYVDWDQLTQDAGKDVASQYIKSWPGMLEKGNKAGGFATQDLVTVEIDAVALRLQGLADCCANRWGSRPEASAPDNAGTP